MAKTYSELNPSIRTLMGPGPSSVHPRVLKAMSTPLVGYLDPDFFKFMDEVKELLRYVFETTNELTIPVSGTGSAGMEACISNLVEADDEVLVCVNGYFGERMCEIVDRYGGKVRRIETPWGKVTEPALIDEALKSSEAKVVAVVHAETSTGARQPLEEIGKIAHENGALLLVDAVTSLGGHPVKVDEWGIDACYSGTQKCLSCPPGLSPVTFSERAVETIRNRKTKVGNWYLDMSLVAKYWSEERTYHHTPPTGMIYGLREALRLVHEEGLEASFRRHELNHRALVAGLDAMGIEMFVEEGSRLWSLNAACVPEGLNDAKIRSKLLNDFNIEIGGGFGALKGKIWRIGLMGYSSSKNNVLMFLAALENVLASEGYSLELGAGVGAANNTYTE
jgi:alanine-glyoxylate transaminase/serine-glyoxylate transaminase/serine-pyruvate transaminase